MRHTHHPSRLARSWRSGVFVLAVLASLASRASTLWTGPNINFSKSAATPSDTIVAGKVVLARGGNNVLYNTAAGETSAGSSSPADTEWAFGTLANFSTLSYTSMESLRDGDLAGVILNKPMVLHLVAEDIYISIEFTVWGQHGEGTFAYTRSTAPAVTAPAPTVSISSPANGTVLSAPASFALAANASVSSGTVTNVAYFAGATVLGQAGASPFKATGSISAAGSYTLTAVATAGGISATSAPVNITLVSPGPVTLTIPSVSASSISFSYSANPGLKYAVQSSSDLMKWLPVSTNIAAGTKVVFSGASGGQAFLFYRVALLPNP